MEAEMNQMGQRIEADLAFTVSELKRDPMAVVKASELEAVAILNHSKVVAYVITPAVWEYLQELYDDVKLAELAEAGDNEPGVEVSIDDLSGDI
jgi:antitoxin StbD